MIVIITVLYTQVRVLKSRKISDFTLQKLFWSKKSAVLHTKAAATKLIETPSLSRSDTRVTYIPQIYCHRGNSILTHYFCCRSLCNSLKRLWKVACMKYFQDCTRANIATTHDLLQPPPCRNYNKWEKEQSRKKCMWSLMPCTPSSLHSPRLSASQKNYLFERSSQRFDGLLKSFLSLCGLEHRVCAKISHTTNKQCYSYGTALSRSEMFADYYTLETWYSFILSICVLMRGLGRAEVV
jgi:hypothetical protein